ncbi:hypothetical protein P5V15_004185 [Pogonomyrmex californicus]
MESLITVGIENLTPTILSGNSTMALDNILITTNGPRALQQIMGFKNQTVIDKVPPDMLHLIDPHWLISIVLRTGFHQWIQWHKILGLVMVILGFMGWTGNDVVVYIFLMTPFLRTRSNLLVINLAFSDFIMMIIMSPPMVINCYYEIWVLGSLMCDIYAMVGSLCGCVSIWTMTAIALDRYNVIVKIFALVWTILPMMGWNRYVPEGNMTACGTDYLTKDWSSKSYILMYSIFVYYTPLFTIIYSYYFIVSAVSAHEKTMREQAKKMNVQPLRSGDNQNMSAEAKLVALMTISLWFIAWTPYLVINYIGIFGGASISPLSTIWGSLFTKANHINSFLYFILYSHPKYRATLKLSFLVCGSTEDPSAAAKITETQSTVTTA